MSAEKGMSSEKEVSSAKEMSSERGERSMFAERARSKFAEIKGRAPQIQAVEEHELLP